jgi:hypothetical protein
MGFHINVFNMPRIQDYKHAKEIFNSKSVVRGENQSVRRLGDRYEKEKWLRQEILDGIEVYTAGYYDTDLVRFYPTHKEITLGNYPSQSTQYFVEYIARINLYQFEHKHYVPAPFTKSPLVKNHQIECYMTQSGERLCMNASDWYKLDYDKMPIDKSQFETPVKYRFDASQMRELRKPYKKLLKYADTMLKLTNNQGMEPDNKLDEQLDEYRGSEKLLSLLADEDKTGLAFYRACRLTQRRTWVSANNYEYQVNIGIIKRWLDKMIKLENPQVLVEVN